MGDLAHECLANATALLAEMEIAKGLEDLIMEQLRRAMFPWEWPDRDPMPRLDWWPWLNTSWWTGPPREAHSRLVGAWEVLWYGVDNRDDW
jgi:hypothetical protein